jgi:acylphosphatase
VTAILLRISGKVQGVAFRYYMSDKAHELNLSGWVRNRSDGTVEAFCQGNEDSVEIMAKWCRLGPPNAGVDHLEITQMQPDSTVKGFRIRPNF